MMTSSRTLLSYNLLEFIYLSLHSISDSDHSYLNCVCFNMKIFSKTKIGVCFNSNLINKCSGTIVLCITKMTTYAQKIRQNCFHLNFQSLLINLIVYIKFQGGLLKMN